MNRIADVLFEPLFLAMLLIAGSYVVPRRWPWMKRGLPLAALALLWFFATPEVSNRIQRALERPVLTSMKPDVTYDAVIVLGGMMSSEIEAETGLPAFSEPAERLLASFDLLRAGRARNAILAGGPPGQSAESRVMAHQLEAWGIDAARLALDERSTNTHENAVESARIARERGWTRNLLVTSAAHMERARGCFAREGMALDTLAVDFVSTDPAKSERAWLPRAGALASSTAGIREAVGRVVYRLRGWTAPP